MIRPPYSYRNLLIVLRKAYGLALWYYDWYYLWLALGVCCAVVTWLGRNGRGGGAPCNSGEGPVEGGYMYFPRPIETPYFQKDPLTLDTI